MAYTAPTVASFKARYPEFADVPANRVVAVLEEVAYEVGELWPDEYRGAAALALVAHLLATGGALTTSDGMVSSLAPGAVVSQRAGDTEIKYSSSATSGSTSSGSTTATSYERTAYGQRYLELRSRSFPAVAIC